MEAEPSQPMVGRSVEFGDWGEEVATVGWHIGTFHSGHFYEHFLICIYHLQELQTFHGAKVNTTKTLLQGISRCKGGVILSVPHSFIHSFSDSLLSPQPALFCGVGTEQAMEGQQQEEVPATIGKVF